MTPVDKHFAEIVWRLVCEELGIDFSDLEQLGIRETVEACARRICRRPDVQELMRQIPSATKSCTELW